MNPPTHNPQCSMDSLDLHTNIHSDPLVWKLSHALQHKVHYTRDCNIDHIQQQPAKLELDEAPTQQDITNAFKQKKRSKLQVLMGKLQRSGNMVVLLIMQGSTNSLLGTRQQTLWLQRQILKNKGVKLHCSIYQSITLFLIGKIHTRVWLERFVNQITKDHLFEIQ